MIDRPHFQQAAYDQGHTDGRGAGFRAGEVYGRSMQRMEDAYRLPMGIGIGIALGATLTPLVLWLKGICL